VANEQAISALQECKFFHLPGSSSNSPGSDLKAAIYHSHFGPKLSDTKLRTVEVEAVHPG